MEFATRLEYVKDGSHARHVAYYLNVVADLLLHSFPIHPTVAGGGHVGEDGIPEDRPHSVGIRAGACAGRDAEKSVLRVDGA